MACPPTPFVDVTVLVIATASVACVAVAAVFPCLGHSVGKKKEGT